MENQPRLSICIPTHHGRVEFLRQAIDGILSQIVDDLCERVEICISDNASDDGTENLIHSYIIKYPGVFRYQRSRKNEGFTVNLLKACELARGDYCWLFSSDDYITESGVAHIVKLLDQYPDVAGLSVMRVNYDYAMAFPIVQDVADMFPRNFESAHQYTAFDEMLTDLCVFFTYAPSQIVNRKLWMEIVAETTRVRLDTYTVFPHLYLIGAMARKNPRWWWCPEKLVKNRTENDSLLQASDQKIAQYRLKTMADIVQIYSDLLGRRTRLFQSVINRFYRLWWNGDVVWRHIKLNPKHTLRGDVQLLYGFTKRLYFLPEFWWQTFPILLIPHSVVKFAVKIYTWLKSLR